jgi:capsular polysaccharide biosynthesis protein
MIADQKKDIKALAKDPHVTRNIQFGTPAVVPPPPPPVPVSIDHLPYVDKHGRQVMPTPKDNVAMAVKLLEADRSPEAIE